MRFSRSLALCTCCLTLAACATTRGPTSNTTQANGSEASADALLDRSLPVTTDVDGSVPERYRKAIEIAQIEGHFLFREDRAAWLATDEIVAKGILSRHMSQATGWLTNQIDASGNIWNVVFTSSVGESPSAYADVSVDFSGEKPVVSARENSPLRPLSEWEDILSWGSQKMAEQKWLRCAETYNTSTQVFIDEGKKYVVVRMMPAWKVSHIQPMGGFHRFRIPTFENGTLEHFAQTETCLDVDTNQLKAEETFGMTLLKSVTPTEFDVFNSLNYNRPHYVITKESSWRVESGKIFWLGETTDNKQ